MSTTTNEWTTFPSAGRDGEIKSLKEYLDVVRRRKWYLILPAVLILAAAITIAFALPPVYRSTGKILIEQQEIPQEWVPSTVTSFADQRIEAISQRVLTTSNLMRVIEEFNLFAEARSEERPEVVVQRMRDNFNIEMISAKVRDPQSGRAGVATIAFSVSFDHRSPVVAQKVANVLISLYLEENVKTRAQAVADTTRFLEEEAGKLADQLADIEARIAAFKQENMGQLPEQQDLNLQLLQRAEQALLETQRRIRSMEERKTYLESALAQMQARPSVALDDETGGSTDPATALQALRMRYASLSGIYAEDHPDLARLRRRIDALEQNVSEDQLAAADKNSLEAMRQELAMMQERYAEDHPDVVRLRSAISALEQQPGDTEKTKVVAGDGDPALVKVRTDLKSVESELVTLRQQAERYAEMVRSIEQRITETPRTEQEYRQLTRDHENVLAKYRDIRAKQSTARVSESLEEDRKGERFNLIEPPELPRDPIKPDRLAIVMLGFAASLFGGVGAVVAREMMDNSVRGAREVIAATNVPLLGVIPSIETLKDRRRTRLRRLLLLTLIILCIAGAAALLHFYYRPLDLLWYETVYRRLELLLL